MADIVRCGKVSSVNYEAGTFEVTYEDRGNSVTGEINMVSNGLYRMPKVGQTVCVLHNSNGTEEGTSIGTIWNKENQPEEGFEGLWRIEFDAEYGKAYLRYDGTDESTNLNLPGELTLNIGDKTTVTLSPDGKVTIKAPTSVTIDTDTAKFTGDVSIAKNLSVSKDVSVSGKTSVTGNISSNGNVSATGNVEATADVKAGAGVYSLMLHKHNSMVTGVPSGPAIP